MNDATQTAILLPNSTSDWSTTRSNTTILVRTPESRYLDMSDNATWESSDDAPLSWREAPRPYIVPPKVRRGYVQSPRDQRLETIQAAAYGFVVGVVYALSFVVLVGVASYAFLG